MKLEVGKYYKTRDGRKVGPMYDYNGSDYFSGEYMKGGAWKVNGYPSFHNSDDSPQLIAPWTEPETGTLAELNVKVGDVVEYAGRNKFKVSSIDGDKYFSLSGFQNEKTLLFHSDPNWRIVSRANERTDLGLAIEDGLREYAQPSPVITETVTRKRIVEGLYGKLSVGNAGGGWIQLALTDRAHDPANHVYVGHATLSRDDVIAARDHLNQLIDAME